MDQQFVSVHIKLALISQLEESPRYLLFHVWWALHVFSSGLSISQQFILYSPMLLYVFPNKKKKNPCYDMMICLGANTLVGSVVRSLWPCLSGLGSSHLHSQLLVGILSGVDPLHDLARTAGAYVRSAPCPGVKYSHKGPNFSLTKKKKKKKKEGDMLRWILYKRSPYTFIKNRSPYIVGFSWKLCGSSYLLHLTFLPLVFYQIKKLTKALTALI